MPFSSGCALLTISAASSTASLAEVPAAPALPESGKMTPILTGSAASDGLARTAASAEIAMMEKVWRMSVLPVLFRGLIGPPCRRQILASPAAPSRGQNRRHQPDVDLLVAHPKTCRSTWRHAGGLSRAPFPLRAKG